jgi:glycosyltransferase involved in cell wall biosynthesis
MPKPSGDSASKPEALFLAPESPYPTVGGGPLRAASLLEYLARRYDVDVIIFRAPGEAPVEFPPGLVRSVSILQLPAHSKSPIPRALRNLKRLALGRPPLVDRFSGFGEAIPERHYQLGVIEHFWCAPYLAQLRPCCDRVWLDLHNVESLWHARVAAAENPLNAFALRRFAQACRKLERELLPGFDRLLTASPEDAAWVRSIAPDAEIIVYPNAIPLVPAPARAEREAIVFSGNLEYRPNLQAIQYFRRRIWPLLRERRPNLKWRLVGKNPEAAAPLIAGDPRIELIGSVEDAISELAQAQVAVVPLLAGSGTRIKILEAWAAATPVVSTSLGAEGLACTPGEHLLFADDPAAFADAVSGLLASPQARARLGAAGRRLYERGYTWPSAWAELERNENNETQGPPRES